MAKINTFLDPTIILDEIAMRLTPAENNPGDINFTEILGQYYPVVQINAFNVGPNLLQSFRLSSEGYIPELEFSFVDLNSEFKSLFYPKDGDVISVYIKSNDDKTFKPIRIDFDIMSFEDLGEAEFSVRGVMNIPLFTTEICKAYPELSSHELLQKIAEELELGFASNEDATSDKMTWLNAYDSYERFMIDSTTHSYKDDRSFFTSFIDFYYYVNMINVNKQFEEYETETAVVSTVFSPRQNQNYTEADAESDPETRELDLFLTNHPDYRSTNFGITDYRLINESGTVWKNNGYKRFAQFFDLNDNEYYSFFVDPITSEGSEENSVLMKGRPGDIIYEDINRFKYLGVQLSPEPVDDRSENEEGEGESTEEEGEERVRPTGSNVHRNYHYSKIQNIQNNEEIKKITVKATIPTVNSQIYRYQTIPVLFYESSASIINTLNTRDREVEGEEKAGENNNKEEVNFKNMKLNSLISGLYVVTGIAFVWDEFSASVQQELTLTRREWPIQLPKEFETRNPRKSNTESE